MSSRDLNACAVRLQDLFSIAREAYEHDHPGHRIEITCTARDVDEQQRLYEVGRRFADGQWIIDDDPRTAIVTQCDGVSKLSEHNHIPARAVDFCIVINGKTVWADRFYDAAGPYFQRVGLIWGGAWPTFKDRPHVELAH